MKIKSNPNVANFITKKNFCVKIYHIGTNTVLFLEVFRAEVNVQKMIAIF